MSHSCQIPTPLKYVKFMLDEAGYISNLYGKTVLENSCGEGNILCEIVSRYIVDCKMHKISMHKIQVGLERDIVGYETDKACLDRCIERLDQIICREGIPSVRWNIICGDFLKTDKLEFDYIIGNPPYITYHDIKEEERNFLKRNFASCKNGRFDYYYAFIEKSYLSLRENGILEYLIPFSTFRNKFAQNLRKIIYNDVVSIIDCRGHVVFDNVTTSVAVIKIIKGCSTDEILYSQLNKQSTEHIKKRLLAEKWFFDIPAAGKRFGDYYQVKNSVATLYNNAFLLTQYEDAGNYYKVNGYRIEKKLVRPAVSTKSCKKKTKDLIIFPYKKAEAGYERYTESEFQSKFPQAYKYLKVFLKPLMARKINSGVKWYEYGRTQAIGDVDGNKLIIPMVITSKVIAYKAGSMDIPYAGYFIKSKGNGCYNLEMAKKILESPNFYDYVKKYGTPTTASSYRISVKEIENYTF